MAISNITYDTKVALYENAGIADINKVKAADMNEIKSVVNNNATELTNVGNELTNLDTDFTALETHIGQVLWTGTFTSGTLTVPHLNEYTMIAVQSGNLLMFGNAGYGGGLFRQWAGMATSSYTYRYIVDLPNNTLTTTAEAAGATDGTNNIAINKIIGVF